MSEDRSNQRRLRRVLAFPAAPAALSGVRETVREQLRTWDLLAVTDDAELVVSELAGNVIRHVGEGTDTTLVLESAEGRLRLEVHDQSCRLPQLLPGGSDEAGGRGLHLVAGLAADWGTVLTSTGKAVWCEIRAVSEERSRQVQRAEAALAGYRAGTGGAAPSQDRPAHLLEELAVDLIADLLHWVRARGGDPGEVLDGAVMHFESEADMEAA